MDNTELQEKLTEALKGLTTAGGEAIIPLEVLRVARLAEKGRIICNMCRRACDSAKCVCGSERFLVEVYWQGKARSFRRNEKGETLSRKEAEGVLLEINRKIEKKQFDPEKFKLTKRLFSDVIDEYIGFVLERLKKYYGSPGFYRNLTGYRKKYFSVLDEVPFEDIHGEEINKLWLEVDSGTYEKNEVINGVKTKVVKPIKSKTKRNIMDCLHAFYTEWVKKQLWAEFIIVPPFPVIEDDDDSEEMVAVDHETQDQIIRNVRNAKCESCRPDQRGKPAGAPDLYEFTAETGIRESEVCLIKVKNVFLDHRDMWMDQHLVRFPGNPDPDGKTWVVWPGLKSSKKKKKRKDKKGRFVQLSHRAMEIAMENMQGKGPEDYLFRNPFTNEHYNPDEIYRAHHNHSGASDVSFHEVTRHTYVTDVLEQDIPARAASLLTGQSERTIEGYDHPRRKRAQQVMDTYQGRKVVSIEKYNRRETDARKDASVSDK